MNQLKYLAIALFTIQNVYALDIQSKFRNSDKSTYESISDYKILRQGYLQTSFSYSLGSNPYVEEDSKVGGINDLDFSAVYGLNSFLELGISAPYISTITDSKSNIDQYTGFSDIYLEAKINIFDYFSIIPVYILSMGNGEFTSGSRSGGFGGRIVGGKSLNKKLNLNYTVGKIFLDNSIYRDINQSERDQFGLGLSYYINDDLTWGAELLHDSMINRKSTELLNHFTLDLYSLKTRLGMGSGIGNQREENNVRVFVSLISDFNIFSKDDKNKKYSKVQTYETTSKKEIRESSFDYMDVESDVERVESLIESDVIIRKNNSIDEVDKEKLKKELSSFINKENKKEGKDLNSLEGHSVLPFYTIEEVRKKEVKKDLPNEVTVSKALINEKFVNRTELDIKDIKYLKSREMRIKETLRSVDYFIDLYEKKEITKEKAVKEFHWAKRLLRMRRSSIDKVAKKIKKKYGKDLDKNKITVYSTKSLNEKKAMNILRKEKAVFKKIIIKAKNKNLKKEEKAIKNKLSRLRANKLRAEQAKVMADGRTLMEIKNSKKNKIIIVKKDVELVKKELPKSIVPKFKIKLRDTSSVVKETKDKINSLMEQSLDKDTETSDYSNFYNDYKIKIEEIKKKEMKLKLDKEKEEFRQKIKIQEELNKVLRKKNKDKIEKYNTDDKSILRGSGEVEVIELKNYKVKSLEERYLEIKQDNTEKIRNQQEYPIWNNTESSVIEEDGYIEKSKGPSY
jgi:hypothetical protein